MVEAPSLDDLRPPANLVVDEFGAFLGKHAGRLQVSVDKRVVSEAPLLHLQQVLIIGRGISLSADAIRACCTAGIPIHFIDPNGEPYAALYSAGLTGTVLTRREQLLAYTDQRGVALAVGFATAKITNQAGFLRYTARYRHKTDPEGATVLQEAAERVEEHIQELRSLQAANCDEIRERILSIEGRAARPYWEALRLVVPAELGWPGRLTRGARDPINSALNYGYGILYGQIQRALVLAGLDPYAGFVHADRPGKPSLVFDLIEEFRTAVVDRTVFGMVGRGAHIEQEENGRLSDSSRRSLAEKILNRLEAGERYRGKRYPLRTIIQMQARQIATFVRGERSRYRPFIAHW